MPATCRTKRRLARLILALAFLAVWCAQPALARKKVTLSLPRVEEVDITGIDRMGLVGWDGDTSGQKLGIEGARLLKRRLERSKRFKEIRLIPLEMFLNTTERLAGQNVAKDTVDFWKAIEKELSVDGLALGTLHFSSKDRSGYYERRWLDDRTGMVLWREEYQHRVKYEMEVTLKLVSCLSGEVLKEKSDTRDETIIDSGSDDLYGFYGLVEPLVKGFVEAVAPQPLEKTFYLLD